MGLDSILMMGGHAFWLSANVFFLCLQIHLFANYLSRERCTAVEGVKSSSFRTYLVRSSAANETFPDAFDFNLRSTECEGICNSMWLSDSVIPRDRVYLIMNNSTNRLIICAGLTAIPYKIKKKWSKSRISYY